VENESRIGKKHMGSCGRKIRVSKRRKLGDACGNQIVEGKKKEGNLD